MQKQHLGKVKVESQDFENKQKQALAKLRRASVFFSGFLTLVLALIIILDSPLYSLKDLPWLIKTAAVAGLALISGLIWYSMMKRYIKTRIIFVIDEDGD